MSQKSALISEHWNVNKTILSLQRYTNYKRNPVGSKECNSLTTISYKWQKKNYSIVKTI